MSIRLRFAPSPTGYLHIGGARTALFNWLYARHVGGKFLLRIEDTDLERSTQASQDAIFDALKWLGIDYDEEVVIQSSRVAEHVRLAHKLLAEGKAYKCFCTSEELEEMRAKAMAEKRQPKYDGTWRDRTDHPTDGTPFTVRFKMPTGGATTVDDLVLGPITVQHDELDDLIILRSDGSPTYNFVVVCDDAFQAVTHVVRGQDHVSNTFRQHAIYGALGYPVPRFGHLPLVDGLSKRKGSNSVQFYRDAGFLPEGVVNYVARLGWSHGDQEIFSIQELIEKFDFVDVNKGSGKFDDQKMLWVNSQWIKRADTSALAAQTLPYLATLGVHATVDQRLLWLVGAMKDRASTLVEIAEGAKFAYVAPEQFDQAAVDKWMKIGTKPAYLNLIAELEALEEFTPATLDPLFHRVLEQHALGMGKLAQPVRIALTGSSVSPPIFDSVAAVGKDECLRRLNSALGLFH